MPKQVIPIRNLYFLLCYAWDFFPEADPSWQDLDEEASVANLYGQLLTEGVEQLIRRGLDRGYIAHTEATPRLKGSIDFIRSERTFELRSGRAWCTYDELTHDVVHNRVVKAGLLRIASTNNVNTDLRDRAQRAARRMRDVKDVSLTPQVFRGIQLHSNITHYRFLIQLCRLLLESSIMDESKGEWVCRDVRKNIKRMNTIFETFLLNYFTLHGEWTCRPGRTNYQWTSDTGAPGYELLPRMQTDVTLRSKNIVTIVEAKYYQRTLVGRWKANKLHPLHLYQLLAYMTAVREEKHDSKVQGVLLYPFVDVPLKLEYELRGFPVRVETIDFRGSVSSIRNQLDDVALWCSRPQVENGLPPLKSPI